jgi:hypothetical protein
MRTSLVSAEEIARAFPSRLHPVPTSWSYRLGLAAVLVTMVVLQAVYLTLVVAAAAATVWWIFSIPSIFATVRLNWFSLLFAIGPPAVLATVTFFLFKPIFVRPLPAPPLPEVTRAEQPELFAFVDSLCVCLGVRPPTVIALSLDVNASASLRHGWRSFLRHDLQLTIGLPLVAGLSLRQFTGVLAHEFGHFAQTAGLRSWFLIQNIRNWFARVAFERDRWDVQLAEWREDVEGWRIQTVLVVAEFAVEASRALLRLLLRVGGIVSSGFSRQMEFNADHFEAAIVGADTFAQTTLDMPAINVALNQSWAAVEDNWQSRRLVDDLPRLVHHYWSSMDGALRSSVNDAVLAETADRYATHPSPSDRIASVRRQNPSGVFNLEGPAERLFRNFDSLSGRITEAHYLQSLGEEKDSAERVAAAAVLAAADDEIRYERVRESLLPEVAYLSRWFGPAFGPGNEGAGDQRYAELLGKLLDQESGLALLEQGLEIVPVAFALDRSDLGHARVSVATTRSKLAGCVSELRASTAAVAHRSWQAPASAHRTAFDALRSEQLPLLELRVLLVRARVVRANVASLPAAQAANLIEANDEQLVHARQEILRRLSTVESAIPLNQGAQTLAAQLSQDADPDTAAAWLLDRADLVGTRLLNRLCFQIELDR